MPVSLILKILLPFIQRKGADRVARFLEDRRTRRLLGDDVVEALTECPPCPPCPEVPAETDSTAEEGEPANSTSPWWYALSGLLVGVTFSAVVYLLVQRLTATR
ncbi:MAG TPA: hypothetical protein PKE64_21005 [Anaerolineae bacterium]|nr:hypothetical protein [Anaerolineae bacterium]HMR66500.1 hypothetical protein [Anaerolineae bacterium]